MSRDWNIVDDADESAEQRPAPDETRLDAERVRLIARERRSADRVRQWRLGVAMLLALAAMILIVRASGWLIAGQHREWALGVIVAALAMLVGVWQMRRGRH